MPFSWPASPSLGQISVQNGRTYVWTGVWELAANVAGHAAQHATGGSDAITPASIGAAASSHTHTAGDVSGLAAVATSGSASDLSAGTLPDARLSANVALLPAMALRAMNENPTAAVDTVPRTSLAFSNVALLSGQIGFVFFTPISTITVSQIAIASSGTAASGLTLARMGLYTFDETNATLVAQTASDTSLFTNTRTIYTRSFSTASGGFPASYQLVAGTRYGVGVICAGTTMPSIACATVAFEFATLTPRVSATRISQTDLGNISLFGTLSAAIWARLS